MSCVVHGPRRLVAAVFAVVLPLVLLVAVAPTARAVTTGANGRIVFDAGAADGQTDIYIVNANGKQLQPLFATSGDDEAASWAPDGSRIVFDSNTSGNYEIYTMAPDGSDVQRLTENAVEDAYPVYSPDGARIAFDSTRSGDYRIWVMNANGTRPRVVTGAVDGHHFAPHWLPDGRSLTFDRCAPDWSVCKTWIVDVTTREADLLYTTSIQHAFTTWSPNGRYMASALSTNGINYEIWRLDTAVPLGPSAFRDLDASGNYAAFSPDGAKIAYASEGDPDIVVMGIAGAGKTPLGLDFAYVEDPDWEPLCTVEGTSGADDLVGTEGPDLICAGGGRDVVAGGDGNDVIFAGGGSDEVAGGGGSDVLVGGAGADVLFGAKGSDLLWAVDQAITDALDGGRGSDLCRWDKGEPVVSCP